MDRTGFRIRRHHRFSGVSPTVVGVFHPRGESTAVEVTVGSAKAMAAIVGVVLLVTLGGISGFNLFSLVFALIRIVFGAALVSPILLLYRHYVKQHAAELAQLLQRLPSPEPGGSAPQ